MAEIKAFRGLRFTDKAGSTGEVCCPPYDIISPEQKKQYLEERKQEVKDRYQFSAYILRNDYYHKIKEAMAH